jgi:streptogramin lyase
MAGAIMVSARPVVAGGAAQPLTAQIAEFATAANPTVVSAGPDGRMWYADQSANAIAIAGGSDTWTIPTAGSNPSDITAGPDGNMWFTESSGNRIGRITPSGTITEFRVPTPNSVPWMITIGPDGNLWFTQQDGQIGRITPKGAVTEFPLPDRNALPQGIAAGPDGAIWFIERKGDAIGRITVGGALTLFPLGRKSSPRLITAGPGGDLWFTDAGTGAIGELTTQGSLREFPLSPAGTIPTGLTVGPDGNVWFTLPLADAVGRITPAGTITTVLLPAANSGPLGIAAAPDGDIWFTEYLRGYVARLGPSVNVTIGDFNSDTALCFNVDGAFFAPNEITSVASAEIRPSILSGSLRTDSAGHLALSFCAPAGLRAGRYPLTVSDPVSGLVATSSWAPQGAILGETTTSCGQGCEVVDGPGSKMLVWGENLPANEPVNVSLEPAAPKSGCPTTSAAEATSSAGFIALQLRYQSFPTGQAVGSTTYL